MHIPFTNMTNLDGSKVAIQRRETGLDPKFEPKIVGIIEEYDAAGDLVNAEPRELRDGINDILQQAGEHGITEADWQERLDPSGERQVVPVHLPGYAGKKRLEREEDAPAISDSITAQLEAHGIYNWEGLSWRRRGRGRHGHDDTSHMTQEIVSDVSEKHPEYEGFEWSRQFILRTTHRTRNGVAIHDKKMKDSELFHYLETGDVDLTISDMQMTRQKPDGWAGEVGPKDDPKRREWARSPEYLDPISLDAALELMSYHKVYGKLSEIEFAKHGESKRSSKKHAKSQLKKRIEQLKNNADQEEVELAEELQRTTSEMGIERFLDVVKETHATYMEELYRLGLKPSSWDYYSPSMIIRDLMKRRVANRMANLYRTDENYHDRWDPLSNGLEARQFRNGLVDLYVGRRFGKEFTQLGKPIPVPTGKVDPESKQPEHKTRREFEPNEDMFRDPSVLDNIYHTRLEPFKKREKIWGPIKKQAELVFKLRTSEPFRPEDDYDIYDRREREKRRNPHIQNGNLKIAERQLGRMLRRTIPPRAWYRETRFNGSST